MKYLIQYIILFLILFIVLYVVEFIMRDKNESLSLSKNFRFIKKKYKLKMDVKRTRLLSKILVVVDTFILSVPIFIMLFTDLSYFKMLGMSFFIFIILFVSLYNLVGYILKKKGW